MTDNPPPNDRRRIRIGTPILCVGVIATAYVSARLAAALRSTGDYLYLSDFPDPVLMPLSIALLLASIGLTLAPLRRARDRARPPACAHCRYETAGLPPDAPCPECGRRRA